jgi:hypothetical protein
MLIYSAIAAAIGVYFELVGLRLLPIPGGSANLHAPFGLCSASDLLSSSPG